MESLSMDGQLPLGLRRVLLVEPTFPIPNKSRLHKNFIPIGLLKLAAYYRNSGADVRLVRGEVPETAIGMYPDTVLVTSLFTYWSGHVMRSVSYYKRLFPNAELVVGGVYASLMPEHCRRETGCDRVFIGVHEEAEKCRPAYDLLDNKVDFQVLHASRGCIRRCSFCGVWRIEKKFEPKRSIKGEILKPKLVFYDNNLLANPFIDDILMELIELRSEGAVKWCESQSGLDGRVLQERPRLASLLKKAGFRYPRIAWDHAYSEHRAIECQIDILTSAGYESRDIFVFMLYNYDLPYEELERKRIKCWEWRVQIADCRYRPLDQTYDRYNPNKRSQDSSAYYVHPSWSDKLVRQFRSNVRRQNICVRYQLPFYSRALENKWVRKDLAARARHLEDKHEMAKLLSAEGVDYWFPNQEMD